MSNQDSFFWPLVFLAAFFLLFLYFCSNHYSVRTYSDPRIFLDFARTLADNQLSMEYPPDQLMFELTPPGVVNRGCNRHIILNGKIFTFVSCGYPLFLALIIKLFGPMAVFFSNGGVFILLFVSLWCFAHSLFHRHPARAHIATLTVFGFFGVFRSEISSLLGCYRDPLAHTLLLFALSIFARALHRPSQISPKVMLATGLLVALSTLIRETNILVMAPLVVAYLYHAYRHKLRLTFRPVLMFGIAFLVGLLPWFSMNYAHSGNPIFPAQMYESIAKKPSLTFGGNPLKHDVATEMTTRHDKDLAKKPSWGVPGIGFENTYNTWRKIRKYTQRRYGVVLLSLMLAGLVLLVRKHPHELLLPLAFGLTFFLFVLSYKFFMWRYFFIVHAALMPLIAFALVQLSDAAFEAFKQKGCRAAILAVGLAFTIPGALRGPKAAPFQIMHARQFRDTIEQLAPVDSLFIAERPLRESIDYLTSSHSVNLDEWISPAHDITLKKAVLHYQDTVGPVFFVAAKDNTYQHDFDHTPVNRELILEHFNLSLVKTLDLPSINLHSLAKCNFAPIYKVTRWDQYAVQSTIRLANDHPTLLQLNARKMWADYPQRSEANVYIEGILLGPVANDGLNWFHMPSSINDPGLHQLSVVSDAPLPNNFSPVLIDQNETLVVPIGAQAAPLDHSYLGPEFYKIPTYREEGLRKSPLPAKILLPNLYGSNQLSCLVGNIRIVDRRLDVEVKHESSDSLVLSVDPEDPRTDMVYFFGSRGGPSSSVVFDWVRTNSTVWADSPPPILEIRALTVFPIPLRPQFHLRIGSDRSFIYLKRGFYHREHHKPEPFRWAAGHSEVRLPLAPVPKTDYLLTLRYAVRPESLDPRLTFNQVSVALTQMTTANETVTAHYDIPAHLMRMGLNEAHIDVASWFPSHSGSKDMRELGMILEDIQVKPNSATKR